MWKMKDERLIELLADYEHNRWARWQKHVFDNSIKNKDGSVTIPKEYVERWTRQINTEYNKLSIEEQLSDKKEAIKILDIIKNE